MTAERIMNLLMFYTFNLLQNNFNEFKIAVLVEQTSLALRDIPDHT